jgi:hypothetical protein
MLVNRRISIATRDNRIPPMYFVVWLREGGILIYPINHRFLPMDVFFSR